MVAALHFVTDEQDPAGIVAAFHDRVCPRSLMVISHVCSTGADPGEVAAVEEIYGKATSPGVFRTSERISGLLAGLEMIPPGMVPAQEWRPAVTGPEPQIGTAGAAHRDIPVLAGVGRVPIGRRM